MTKAKKDTTEYTHYVVALDQAGRRVHILDDEQKAEPGFRKVGEFDANVVEGKLKGHDDFEPKHAHILIAAAQQVLEDLEINDLSGFVYEDKASNSPSKTGDYVATVDEVAKANNPRSEDVNAAEYQNKVSDNIDKAEKKVDPDK